MIVTVI